jgi:hypothetical protein
VTLMRVGDVFIAHGPNGDYVLDGAATEDQARKRAREFLLYDPITERYPMPGSDAGAGDNASPAPAPQPPSLPDISAPP